MDRALYVAMSGALQTLRAQTANSHNLANASTTGFKAQLLDATAQAVDGPGFPTRVNSLPASQGWDSSSGPVQHTGRDLDVALGDGLWLAVQASDGSEAYTRGGDLQLDANGMLRTGAGYPVMGDGGPMSIPPASSISIGADGTVSIVPVGQSASTMAVVGRLKVVSGSPGQLEPGGDGLMRATPGAQLAPASGAVLASGNLEGSNVNLAESMVTMIQLARAFEMQMKVMKSVDENSQAAQGLTRIG